ncbi:hypothetical protein TNCV_4485021 [Trichonephila clavipes]|nr:hypothetical protein TNCV_4485021 [Trichonephila clavipes]
MGKCVQMLDKELWRLGPDGPGVLCANRTREAERDFCVLPIRRDEGRVVDPPLVSKRVLFQETRKKRGEREEPSLGWRKGKNPTLEGESMRGEPWLERTGRER